MNKKIMSLIVVGIFLLATFGSVSACTGGCTIVSDDKKDGCNSSNETNIKEIKNLTKEEIPMEDFEEIIKLAEEKGYEVLYDEAKETIFKNEMRIISIPTSDKYATILKFYYMEKEKKLLPRYVDRERILPLMPLYIKREKAAPAMFIETFVNKENLVAKSTIYYFEGQKLNKVTSIVDGKRNTITIDKNGEMTTQRLNGEIVPKGMWCDFICNALCSVGCLAMCCYFVGCDPICIDACSMGGCTALCDKLC